MRDEDAGWYVNLIPSDTPQDVYQLITDRVIARLQAAGGEWADWWLWVGITRKLIKRPAMTFPYSVTLGGMKGQIDEVYSELHELNEPTNNAGFYLAKNIMAAVKEILPRPAEAMKFIRRLAEQCA